MRRLDSSFNNRDNAEYLDELGALVCNACKVGTHTHLRAAVRATRLCPRILSRMLCFTHIYRRASMLQVVPHGVLAFFGSYSALERAVGFTALL